MKKLFWIACACLMAACTSDNTAPTVPVYGWTGWDDNTTEQSLRENFTAWRDHGVIGVCLNVGMDTMKARIGAQVAHELGMEFHAWAPSMINGECDSTWYTVNRLGESAFNKEKRAYVEYYATLDPHNPDVIQYIIDKYSALADIPGVDYVQFDYIRYADVILSEGLWDKYNGKIAHEWRDAEGNVHEYPGADYCYCDACCADFLAKTGIDIKAKLAEGVDPATINELSQFRFDNVTNLVNKVVEAIHAKGKKVSADVFPGPQSHAVKMVRQEWNKWNVDMFLPMNYNDFYLQPASWLYEITKEEVQSTDKPVFSGLFICRNWQRKLELDDPEDSGLLPSEIAEAVSGAMRAGATGICLFTPNDMTDEHWAELDKAIHKSYKAE